MRQLENLDQFITKLIETDDPEQIKAVLWGYTFQETQRVLIEEGQAEAVTKAQDRLITKLIKTVTDPEQIKVVLRGYTFQETQRVLIKEGQAEAVAQMQDQLITKLIEIDDPEQIKVVLQGPSFQKTQCALGQRRYRGPDWNIMLKHCLN